MISCEYAEQTLNLYYSVIKFVSYKDFVWSGYGLPLVLHSLGEPIQVGVNLSSTEGVKVPVSWERGLIHATFQEGVHYNLDLRIEYPLPLEAQLVHCDFNNIHPKSYRAAIDLQSPGYGPPIPITVDLGGHSQLIAVDQPGERMLDSGHQLAVHLREDYLSIAVSKQEQVPYAHRYFPIFSVPR